MQNKLTNLLREEIDKRYESTKEASSKLRNMQRVYNVLIPNKNKKEIIRIGDLSEELFYEFIELIYNYNSILYKELVKLIVEMREFNKNIEPKVILNSENSILSGADRRYNIMMEKSKEQSKIVKKLRDFFAYATTYFVELYEKLEHEKERKKEERKIYESALKNLSKNRTLTPKEINAITTLIEKQEQGKNDYYYILNEYIRKKEEEVREKEFTKKQDKEETAVIYKDEQIVETPISNAEENDTLILNYLNAINTFQNDEKSLTEFLDGISYNEDFDEILDKLIIIVSEKSDNNLVNYLKRYRQKLNSEVALEDDIVNDEITLLYYGFLQDKEKILNDIEKTIVKEDYKDVLRALQLIKKDGAKVNRKSIVRIRKVFKLRVGNIRVTFKRISKNVYIILGIYRKKDNHGAEIIYSAERRNNHLLRDENQIIKSMELNDLWNLYLQKNIEFEENIFTLLKQSTYKI